MPREYRTRSRKERLAALFESQKQRRARRERIAAHQKQRAIESDEDRKFRDRLRFDQSEFWEWNSNPMPSWAKLWPQPIYPSSLHVTLAPHRGLVNRRSAAE